MTQRATKAQIGGVIALALPVAAIIAVAFRGSWGALRDAALSVHFDRDAADLYPFGVDGLLVIAIIAAVILRNDRVARWYCLGIIAGYTVASFAINFMHGLGMFLVDPATGTRPVPPWLVVALIASLVIASIFLASHLLVYVWRHFFPTSDPEPEDAEVSHGATPVSHDATPRLAVQQTNLDLARAAYRESLAPHLITLSQKVLAERYGIKPRQARAVQDGVKRELAADEAEQPPTEGPDVAARYTPNGGVPVRDGTGGR